MSKASDVDLANAEAELIAWSRMVEQLKAQLAAARSERKHWQGVVNKIKKAES